MFMACQDRYEISDTDTHVLLSTLNGHMLFFSLLFLVQAFGVGALEEDDDDIFSQENITSYHSSLGLPSDTEQSSKYGWTGGKDGGG